VPKPTSRPRWLGILLLQLSVQEWLLQQPFF
jgi:hypothetical protein